MAGRSKRGAGLWACDTPQYRARLGRCEIFGEELEDLPPMALGSGVVVGGGVGGGEAVFDVGVDIEGVLEVCGLEGGFEALLFLGGEMGIDAGDANVDGSAHAGGEQMGAIGLVGGEAGAMERSGGGDAVGKRPGGGEGEGTAHAVADAADFRTEDGGLAIEETQEGGSVFHDQAVVDGFHALHPAVAIRAFLEGGGEVERQRGAGAVVEIGQEDVVAGGREPFGHGAECRADAEGIHVDDHGGALLLLRRAEEMARREAVVGLDLDGWGGHGRHLVEYAVEFCTGVQSMDQS